MARRPSLFRQLWRWWVAMYGRPRSLQPVVPSRDDPEPVTINWEAMRRRPL